MSYLLVFAVGYLAAKGPDWWWKSFAETPTERAKRLVKEGRERSLIDG